jgi:hypothetical protein
MPSVFFLDEKGTNQPAAGRKIKAAEYLFGKTQ